jgi:hypothetical protein
VKIRGYFAPVDFVVLDMETTKESLLILGRHFLSTAGAQIDVGAGEIRFNINGKEEKFDFWPRQEQCSMIRIKYRPNPQGIKEVEIQPQLMDNLVKKSKKRPELKKNNPTKKKKKHQKLFPHRPKEHQGVQTKGTYSTPTPPKKINMVWRTKVTTFASTSPRSNVPSSSKK